jgi:hypothetical protein
MALPSSAFSTTCDVYRPFGAASPTATGLPCRLVPDLAVGRPFGGSGLMWTHYLDLDAGADVRDGCTRFGAANALNYADGDEIRIPSGAPTPRFVVVWVETINQGSPRESRRAYLMRNTA